MSQNSHLITSKADFPLAELLWGVSTRQSSDPWLKRYFRGFRAVAVAWIAFSFLGFSTAIYNPDFHEKLHLHETHEGHVEGQAKAQSHDKQDEADHESNASCLTCNVLSHIATSITPSFQVSNHAHLSSKSFPIGLSNVYLSEFSHSFSSRAPPLTF